MILSQSMFKTYVQYAIPKTLLTTVAGIFANIRVPVIKNYLINAFISVYSVTMLEAVEENPSNYNCFNDFFIRHLKPDCRIIENATCVSPVDGCVSEAGSINEGQLFQAKGHYYSVAELLHKSEQEVVPYNKGHFATLYLSPKDYHRVHMPLDGELISMTYIPGKLFSVKPSTVEVVPKLFAVNKRLILSFKTSIGLMSVVMVGATIVGAIGTVWHGDLQSSKKVVHFDYSNAPFNTYFKKGDELAYFKLGSTVILLFAESVPTDFQLHLKPKQGIKLGQAIA